MTILGIESSCDDASAACRILNDPNQSAHLTIEALAANLGFNSRSNFTVTFKRITGISPSDLMKMAKEK